MININNSNYKRVLLFFSLLDYNYIGDYMKILFFSDIHGIVDNLDYLKELDNKKHFDKVICLGDLFYDTSFNGNVDIMKVDRFLKSFNERLICIKGNCDSNSDFNMVEDYLFNVDGIDIYCMHGHKYNERNNGVVIYGHEHIPYIKKKDNTIFICVGSISLPRRCSECSYCIYENKTFKLMSIYDEVIDEIKV